MLDCNVCGSSDDDDRECHNGSNLHRLNFMLQLHITNRTRFIQYEDVTVEQAIMLPQLANIQHAYDAAKGICRTIMKPQTFKELGSRLHFKFTVRNHRNEAIFLKVQKLYPVDMFSISDSQHRICESLEATLQTGQHFNFIATFQPNNFIGVYTFPLSIYFQPVKNPSADTQIFRDLEITLLTERQSEEAETESPFRNEVWDAINIIEPKDKPKTIHFYIIPTDIRRVLISAFRQFRGESARECAYRHRMLSVWPDLRSEQLEKWPTERNYTEFFHHLLWLDETSQTLGLQHYNMSNVRVRLVRNQIMLNVPGLAEKRPSVLKGDMVVLRLMGGHTGYKGVVSVVEEESIQIEFLNEVFMEIIQQKPNVALDVQFMLTRLQFERMHLGVDNCAKNGMLCSLFPRRPLNNAVKPILEQNDLFNKTIFTNKQQLIAVESILGGTSQKAPYIIYGPPGTGKTVTLVEAILQIKKKIPQLNILVCAPSNAACDMLALKLNEYCARGDLFRIHTGNRNLNDIPNAVKYFSNIEDHEIYQVKASELNRYRIVISTLHLIGKFSGFYSPGMVFIDEAAQATEAECDIPIGLLYSGKPIVLAGDPKQLGPVCGKFATNFGLARSLIDRLMETNELYEPRHRHPLIYDSDYITMLIHNYRSHMDIIYIPNELFYDKSLQFEMHNDPISKVAIAPLIENIPNGVRQKSCHTGRSVEFIGLISKEEKKGHSPSYYNTVEIEMVINVIKKLLDLSTVSVEPSDIGVIAPYVRQVAKIRLLLESLHLNEIQVGTTESFQGGERRIMIISTVRAQSDLLLYDKKYDLGFVSNEKRFNVAITRAKSKLIIIGNPYVLGYDLKCWQKMLEFCEELGSYYGVEYKPRTECIVDYIMRRLKH